MLNAKTKDRIQCWRVCRDTQEYRNESTCWSESLALSLSLFCLLPYSRSCPIVFPFPLLHSRSLSCMRTCHNFCDRYYKPTETNLFFKQYAATVSPNIDRSSCVHVIALECTQNLVLRYKCQIIRYFFKRVVIRQCDLWKRKKKGTIQGFLWYIRFTNLPPLLTSVNEG